MKFAIYEQTVMWPLRVCGYLYSDYSLDRCSFYASTVCCYVCITTVLSPSEKYKQTVPFEKDQKTIK